ncbi:MAG: hypothetical protein R2810_04565 [Flavobacteriales bacterium]
MHTMADRKLLLLTALALATACQDPKETEVYRQLEEDRSDAVSLVQEKDSTINALFGTFNRIGENLRTIREKQGLLGCQWRGDRTGQGHGAAHHGRPRQHRSVAGREPGADR